MSVSFNTVFGLKFLVFSEKKLILSGKSKELTSLYLSDII